MTMETASGVPAPFSVWAALPPGPAVMGILNVTPDSFSDGGTTDDPAAAIEAGRRMLADGATILDIGGESTRPGASIVPPAEEQARILPVIAALARLGALISVDTRNASTMERAVAAGARIVNDVSALAYDPAAPATVARLGCAVVLMHMRGTPLTMKSLAVYGDVVEDVRRELSARVAVALAAGIAPQAIAIDPGFGFAKTSDHNIALLRSLPALAASGFPIVSGISRKATIGHLGQEPDPARRGPGSVAAALFALQHGARVVRVHDVWETVQAVRVWHGLSAAPGGDPDPA